MPRSKKKPKTPKMKDVLADRASTEEFIAKNFVLAPDIRECIARGETTDQILKGIRWLTPLDILEVYANDPRTSPKFRIEAAKAAAPYRHKKMPQDIEVSGKLTLAQLVASASRPPK